ncbi:MAG TPA: hypothetical protein VMX97_00265, partial [Hyphomicrobiaceae bacterium]|nr:hypothetical protein [Hyphomicrobiaceae bacterium]
GRKMEQSKQGAFDPTIGAKAKTDIVSRELVAQKVSLGKPARKAGEDLREYRLRSQVTGKLMEAEISRLVSDPRYSQLPDIKSGDESRNLLIKKAANHGRAYINKLTNDDRYKAMTVPQRLEFLRDLTAPKGSK